MEIEQIGDYTVYRGSDWRDDMLVHPHACCGATVIFMFSPVMDRASVLHIQDITEEEYKALQAAGTDRNAIDGVVNSFWRK